LTPADIVRDGDVTPTTRLEARRFPSGQKQSACNNFRMAVDTDNVECMSQMGTVDRRRISGAQH